MKNMKLSNKFSASFAIVIALAIVLSVASLFAMRGMANDAARQYETVTLPLDQMVRFSLSYGTARSALRDLGHVRLTDDDPQRYIAIVETDLALAVQHIRTYYDMLTPSSPSFTLNQAEYDAVSAVYHAILQYKDISLSQLMPLMVGDTRSVPESLALLHDVLAPIDATIKDNIYFLTSLNSAQGLENAQQANATFIANVIMNASILLVIILAVIILGRYLSNIVSKPLAILDEWMQMTANDGIIDWTPEEEVILAKYKDRTDEIGHLYDAYVKMVAYIEEACGELTLVADGKLDHDVIIRSEQDRLSLALQKTIADLNNMFGEIKEASVQVAAGSQQIASGAQALAQSSAEQSASIEQLSASAVEISDKTKSNAKMAGMAAQLAVTIKDNAEKGNRQMNEMVGAVDQISQASQSISKVIKVIDDIAFQTNILALNAAVEAARAGQHGKGFAVVADEVRTLAAKSAEAAKDTGALISNSMEKAAHGANIAKGTAESLAEIVTGINESSEIIGEIAEASDAQTTRITQINSNIDHVASLVQQNSTAAEESSTSAGELSDQSDILERLVSRFRLRNSGERQRPALTANPVPNQASFSINAPGGKY